MASSAPDDPASGGSSARQTPAGNSQMDVGQPPPWADGASRNFAGPPPPWQRGFPPNFGPGSQVPGMPGQLPSTQWPPGVGLPDPLAFQGQPGMSSGSFPVSGGGEGSQSYGGGHVASSGPGIQTIAPQQGHEDHGRHGSGYGEGPGHFSEAPGLGVDALLKAARSQADSADMGKAHVWDQSRYGQEDEEQGYRAWGRQDYDRKDDRPSHPWPGEGHPYADRDPRAHPYYPPDYGRPDDPYGRGPEEYRGPDLYDQDPYHRGFDQFEARGREFPPDPYGYDGGDGRPGMPDYGDYEQRRWEAERGPGGWEEKRERPGERYHRDESEHDWHPDDHWNQERRGWGGVGGAVGGGGHSRMSDWDADDYGPGDDDDEDIMSENWVPHPKSKWPMRAENFEFQLACKTCFIKYGEGLQGYSYQPLPGHPCNQNMLLVRNKADKGPEGTDWVHIRRRPNTTGMKYPNFDYKLCEQFQRGLPCKVGSKKCTFPHHRLELRVWTMDRAGSFSLKGFMACLKRGFVNVDREHERQAAIRETKQKLMEEQEKVQSSILDLEQQLKEMDQKVDDLRRKQAEQQRIKDLGVANDIGLISYPMLKPKSAVPASTVEQTFSAVPPPALLAPPVSVPAPAVSVSIPPLTAPAAVPAPVSVPMAVPAPKMVPPPTMVPAPTMVPPPTTLPVPSMVPPPSSLPTVLGLSLPTMVPPPSSLPAPSMVPPPKSLPLPGLISLPSLLPAPSLLFSSVPSILPLPTLTATTSMSTPSVGLPQVTVSAPAVQPTPALTFTAGNISPTPAQDFQQVLSAQQAALQQLTAAQQLPKSQQQQLSQLEQPQSVLLSQPVAMAPVPIVPEIPQPAPVLPVPAAVPQQPAPVAVPQLPSSEQASLDEQRVDLERSQEMIRLQLRELNAMQTRLNQQVWQLSSQPDPASREEDFHRDRWEDGRSRSGRYRSPSPERWRKRSRLSTREPERGAERSSRRSPERSRRSRSKSRSRSRSRSSSPRRRSPNRSRRSPASKRSRWSSPDRSESRSERQSKNSSSPNRDGSPDQSSSTQDRDKNSRESRRERKRRRWDPSPENSSVPDLLPATEEPPSAQSSSGGHPDHHARENGSGHREERDSSPRKSPEPAKDDDSEPFATETQKAAELKRKQMDEEEQRKRRLEEFQEKIRQLEELKRQAEEEFRQQQQQQQQLQEQQQQQQQAEKEEEEEEEEEEEDNDDRPRPEPLTQEEWEMAKMILQLQRALSVMNKTKGAFETLAYAHALSGISAPINYRCHTFIPPTGGQHKHTAFVFLGKLVLATTQVEGKKTFLKNIIFAIALKNLKNKSMYRLAKFKYEGNIDLEELLKSDQEGTPLPPPPQAGVPEARRACTAEKLMSLQEDLVALRGASDSDVGHGISKVWEKRDINAAVLYLTKEYDEGDVWVECEIYLEDLLVVSGEGRTKKASRYAANRLLVDTLDAELAQKIVESGRNLACTDRNQSAALDFRYYHRMKHQSQEKVEDNTFMLKKLNIWPGELNRPVEELVVVESEDTRHRNAFSELLSTVSQNGMLLELDTQKRSHHYMCTVYIQMRNMGSAEESSRKAAISEACFQALQHLEESCDIIKCRKDDDLSKMTKLEDILKLASQFKKKGGEVSVDNPADKMPLVKALRQILDNYLAETTLAPLTFPDDMPITLRDLLFDVVHKKHQSAKQVKAAGKSPAYIYVQKNRRWMLAREKLLLLQLIGESSGRYEILKCQQKASPESLEIVRQQYLAGLEITGSKPSAESSSS